MENEIIKLRLDLGVHEDGWEEVNREVFQGGVHQNHVENHLYVVGT